MMCEELQPCEYEMFNFHSDKAQLFIIHLVVAGTDLAMEINTGAGVTIVSEETFRQLQTRQSMNLSP